MAPSLRGLDFCIRKKTGGVFFRYLTIPFICVMIKAILFEKRCKMKRRPFFAGMQAGMPICIGYFSVSFGFGAMAIAQGWTLWQAVLASVTTLAGAGQFAGLTVITAGAALLELVLTMLVINSRYALMSLSLGQRLGPQVGFFKRLGIAFFNTDEVFALSMSRGKDMTPAFFIGAGVISALGWVSGTALGSVASSLLPLEVRTALGVMLYGMFIAIIVPQARQEKPVFWSIGIALVCSCLFAWVPGLNQISSGFAVILSTIIAATVCAIAFPVKEEDTE